MKTLELFSDKQHEAVDWLQDGYRGALLADMGVGKTIISLTHLNNVRDWPVLIISTKRVVDLVWEQEAAEWVHTQDLSFVNIEGNAKLRAERLQPGAHIYLININNIQWFLQAMVHHPDMKFKALILDELSLWKGAGAWWKALRKFAANIESVIGLTGTPASNGYFDLWAQMELIQPGMLCRTKTLYKQKYFYCEDEMCRKKMLRPGAEEEIKALMADHVFRMSNKGNGTPELSVSQVPVDVPKEAKDIMATFRRESYIEIGTFEISGDSAASAVNKLAQMCSGRVYDDVGNVVGLHSAKVDACSQMVAEQQGSPVMIAYYYEHDLEALQHRFPDAPHLGAGVNKADAERIVNDWNAGLIPVLLINPASAGHGLNLQKGPCHHIIWYSLIWDLDFYDQLNARVCRQGQAAAIVYVHQLIGGPEDRVIAAALSGKDDVQQALLDYFEEIQRV